MTYYTYFNSPLQSILLIADNSALMGLYMTSYAGRPPIQPPWSQEETPILNETKQQLSAYFEGKLTAFDLPISMQGTEFQKRIWNELLQIPYGSTMSYRELALSLGTANGARAVGSANARNPISIIVPCHRLIGSNGDLRGYTGGISTKRTLIGFEKSVLEGSPFAIQHFCHFERSRRIGISNLTLTDKSLI